MKERKWREKGGREELEGGTKGGRGREARGKGETGRDEWGQRMGGVGREGGWEGGQLGFRGLMRATIFYFLNSEVHCIRHLC